MILRIKNVGVISEAEIAINGLTVLTGYNGTGKTTVAKVLNTAVNVVLNKELYTNNYINDIYENRITKTLASIAEKNQRQKVFFPIVKREIFNYIIDVMAGNYQGLKNYMSEFLGIPNIEDIKITIDNNDISLSIDEILGNLASELNVYKNDYEAPAITHIFNTIRSYIPIIENRLIRLTESNDDNIDYCNFSVIQDTNQGYFKSEVNLANFFETIIYYDDCELYNIHEYNNAKASKSIELEEPFMLLKEMIGGQIKTENGKFSFINKFGSQVSMDIVASGIYQLAPFYKLLEENMIESNCIFIIDEPETHLHPEWQVKYAEILSVLVKNGVTVVVSTHSPIFISALQKFSSEIGIIKNTSYYLGEINTEGKAIFTDYTENVDRVLDSLFSPFHNIVWS